MPDLTPSSSGTIRINRISAPWRDRVRAYQALLDDTVVGKARDGESIDLAVSVGQHDVKLKVDWRYNNALVVAVDSNQVTRLECAPDTASRGLIDTLCAKGPCIDLYVLSG